MSQIGPSVLSTWTQSIAEFLRTRSLDPAPIFAAAGLDLAALRDPHARLPIHATSQVWREVVTATGDEACGLRISAFVRPTTFHALGFAVLASNTLGEALDRLQRYGRVMTDAGAIRLEPHAQGVALRLELGNGRADIADQAIDALLSLIVRVCRLITANDFDLKEVHLHRVAPGSTETFARFFRAPVYFAAAHDLLVLDARALERPMPLSNPELAAHGDRQVAAMLEADAGRQLRARVVGIVARMLTSSVTPEAVAKQLAMSVRSMQRRLHEEGTTFQELLRETREQLARSYLRDPALSVTEVAFLLGFADASAFTRAFRAWTGQSPSAFRES